MDKLIYTIMSAADRVQYALQVHANNLANAQTNGYRADRELAESRRVSGPGFDTRHQVEVIADELDQSVGPTADTGRQLDLAIDGPGYFAVGTDRGEAYTRDGNLHIDGDGRLTTSGHPVIGAMGPIVLPQYDSIRLGEDGTISLLLPGELEMQVFDRIKLVRPDATTPVTKDSEGLIVAKNGAPLPRDETVVTRGGHLESSNVSSIEELMKTTMLNRDFEIQMRMYKAADDDAEMGNQLIRG